MPPRAMTFEAVKQIGLRLPGVAVGTAYGSPALKLHDKLLACLAANKAAEPNTLVVRIDFAQRDEMIADDPATYYLKDHYVDYPCVLVRLSRVRPDAVRDLLSAAWRFVDATARRKKPAGARSARPRAAGARLRRGRR